MKDFFPESLENVGAHYTREHTIQGKILYTILLGNLKGSKDNAVIFKVASPTQDNIKHQFQSVANEQFLIME